MTNLVIYTNKNINSLNFWNGHDLRLLKIKEHCSSIKITNNLMNVKNECAVIDIPGIGIREYLKICLASRKFIRNVFLQDSQIRYNYTKIVHILKFKRYDLLNCSFFINFIRAIVREVFFYIFCKKIGFVSEKDAFFKKKCIISKNGVERGVKLSKEKKEGRLVFWGNLNYEPNIESIVSYVKSKHDFFLKNNLHLFGRASKKSEKKLCDLNIFGKVIVVHGSYDRLEEKIYKSDVFFNCVDFGSGIKNKTLESIQLGIRQLATTHAIEGISLKESSVVIFDKRDELKEKLQEIKKIPINPINHDLQRNNISWDKAVEAYMLFCEDQ